MTAAPPASLALAFVAELDDQALDALADRLAPRLLERLERDGARSADWMTSKEAAAYLGLSVNALHKLTAARALPFSQVAPGHRCYFHRAALDEWRRRDQRGPRA